MPLRPATETREWVTTRAISGAFTPATPLEEIAAKEMATIILRAPGVQGAPYLVYAGPADSENTTFVGEARPPRTTQDGNILGCIVRTFQSVAQVMNVLDGKNAAGRNQYKTAVRCSKEGEPFFVPTHAKIGGGTSWITGMNGAKHALLLKLFEEADDSIMPAEDLGSKAGVSIGGDLELPTATPVVSNAVEAVPVTDAELDAMALAHDAQMALESGATTN